MGEKRDKARRKVRRVGLRVKKLRAASELKSELKQERAHSNTAGGSPPTQKAFNLHVLDSYMYGRVHLLWN